ncbi:MAG: 50S ribosomal protein L16 [Nanoarchaeota archaeon]|nr:50S ribosomal protein L16 [Nanoarchaeota archaeon]MBU4242377.1 50S ribosomal protein L16 [Nanoarchaeota archaeon]MBU4352121.1 50S ribosomal protein L16 [Nanoarchaeota archaeon]MBU4455893.1 50S ribosomal protein L16 [Nanoarchaeota archaeon]MCG2720230.1 50S ribosomal protein L16 [Nanoarchaeota archaeon]
MAGIRPGHCYTPLERAYTRKSKYKKKAFIKSVPAIKIAKYDMGDLKRKFEYRIDLVSKEAMQIRDNSLECARIILVRSIESQNKIYHLKLKVFPHHILRENKMLTGAGADRMQTGMQRAFGRSIGCAARVKVNQALFSLSVDEVDAKLAVDVLKKAIPRLPCKCKIVSTKLAK